MLFPTHLVVAYVVGRRWELPAYWAVAGAALPDVVDKPLAMAGVTTLYHTVGHSLLALLVGAVALLVGRNRAPAGGAKWTALWIGWSSHLALDAAQMVVNGRPADVLFLAWPFVIHRPQISLGPVDFAVHYLWSPAFFLEVGLWIVAGFALWSSIEPE